MWNYFLFNQFCIQFYGADVWFYNEKCKHSLHQFAVGYHKAVKKLLGLSTHESNHFACQEASLLTFEHLLNKIKVLTVIRLFNNPCVFIEKILSFLMLSSVCLNEIRDTFLNRYEVECIFEQDRNAIMSKIFFMQNHEPGMREGQAE